MPAPQDANLFRIKICGITRPEDARHASQSGADGLGLNFYPASSRYLPPAVAREIVAEIPQAVAKVGVFVNESADTICRLSDDLELDFIQLHGDEPPDFLALLAPRPIVRAFRLTAAGWDPIVEYLAACRELQALPAALLLDAHVPGTYGGTGQVVDWQSANNRAAELASMPIILAGGLTAENVAEAIAAVRPWGVDTASGVESAPGVKESGKVKSFVENARRALQGHP